jgi:D-inositol-3-phosphate glycosyltransferase
MSLQVAVLSMHTSPLAQPGTGDGGGMNVYVRELATALARAGVTCEVFTRAESALSPAIINVEPGFRVHNVVAGPTTRVAKEDLVDLTGPFADAVHNRLAAANINPQLIHANYWLSAVAGHQLKHDLDVPLVTTFHTLARVKNETDQFDLEPQLRADLEASTMGCTDMVLANTAVESEQLQRLYGAEPARIEEVPLGVDHAFFSPGNRAGARAALKLGPIGDGPILLYVGRIQPLKGTDLAVETLAAMRNRSATLVVVGGPSGANGQAEVDRVHALADALGVADRVRWVDPQPHHLLSTYYRAADVCLVPSKSESFGLVALEAGACGTPVVASNVGGLQTIIDQGSSGYLVDGRDPVDWAHRVDSILSDPQSASAMAFNAANRSQRYAWSYTAARLRRLYGDLTARSLVDCA